MNLLEINNDNMKSRTLQLIKMKWVHDYNENKYLPMGLKKIN